MKIRFGTVPLAASFGTAPFVDHRFLGREAFSPAGAALPFRARVQIFIPRLQAPGGVIIQWTNKNTRLHVYHK
jgi:hypothetical protein